MLSIASADLSRVNLEELPRITGAAQIRKRSGKPPRGLALSDGILAEGFTDLMLPSQFAVGETAGPAR